MDGWALLAVVQQGSPYLPCIAVTAFHSADVAVKAIEAGFVAYFPKPLDPASFVQELTNVLM
jgi:DNA-binding NtrC family response regulator